jgi:hypothetical protein
MEKIREMNRKIFKNNFLVAIREITDTDIDSLKIKIVPINEPGKPLNALDDQMRLIALSEKNVGKRLLSVNDASRLLSCNVPLVPIWINISSINSDEQEDVLLVETSLRFRKPSLLRNAETGHPPFKAIIEL